MKVTYKLGNLTMIIQGNLSDVETLLYEFPGIEESILEHEGKERRDDDND